MLGGFIRRADSEHRWRYFIFHVSFETELKFVVYMLRGWFGYSIQHTVYDTLLTTLLRYSKQPVAPVVQLITSKLSDVGT